MTFTNHRVALPSTGFVMERQFAGARRAWSEIAKAPLRRRFNLAGIAEFGMLSAEYPSGRASPTELKDSSDGDYSYLE